MAVRFPTNAEGQEGHVHRNRWTAAINAGGPTLNFGTPSRGFYFDASVAGPTDVSGVWSSDGNAFNGLVSLAAAGGVGILKGTGTSAPDSGPGPIVEVQARDMTNQTAGLTFLTLTAPSGGWTWEKVSNLHVEFNYDGSDVIISYWDSDGGTKLGEHTNTGYSNTSGASLRVIVEGDLLMILAVGDDNDITWNTPSGWTEFGETNDGGGDDASIGCWYIAAEDTNAVVTSLVRTGSEELVGVIMLVEGVDTSDTSASGSVEVDASFASRTNTTSPDPTSTGAGNADGFFPGDAVIAHTGNRSDAEHLGSAPTGLPWNTSPPSGYTIESGTPGGTRGTNAQGGPGRLEQGSGNGDAQQTWAYKILTAAAATEDPGAFSGFTNSARDHKVYTWGIRAKKIRPHDPSYHGNVVQVHDQYRDRRAV